MPAHLGFSQDYATLRISTMTVSVPGLAMEELALYSPGQVLDGLRQPVQGFR